MDQICLAATWRAVSDPNRPKTYLELILHQPIEFLLCLPGLCRSCNCELHAICVVYNFITLCHAPLSAEFLRSAEMFKMTVRLASYASTFNVAKSCRLRQLPHATRRRTSLGRYSHQRQRAPSAFVLRAFVLLERFISARKMANNELQKAWIRHGYD